MATQRRDLPPLIAVTADAREGEAYRWHGAPEPYLKAVTEGLGGIPLIVPALGEAVDIPALLERIDGVLVTGSRSNVYPKLYDEEPTPAAEPYDRLRDATTLPLIRATLVRAIPMFAICRGMQELNVALGGTLVPEVHAIEGRHDHRAPDADNNDARFAIRQDLAIAPEGRLSRILGPGPVRVNSLHHQGIGRLADRLAVEATAPDGTIEAVSVKDAPGYTLGVQWHPEYWVTSDEPSAKLFQAFGNAVRAYRKGDDTRLVAAE
jgi:putative glutamine amidotransferase